MRFEAYNLSLIPIIDAVMVEISARYDGPNLTTSSPPF